MVDSVHSRYVSYIKQTTDQKDSAKTDYTYAKSYSYRRRMDDRLMYEWSVPNMCRKSLNSLITAVKSLDGLSHTSKVESILSLIAKGINRTDISEECVADNQTNDKLLRLHQFKDIKSSDRKLFSVYFLLVLLIVFVSLICLSFTPLRPLFTNALKIQKNDINYIVEQLAAIKMDLKTLKDCNIESKDLFSRVNDIDSKVTQLFLSSKQSLSHCLKEDNDRESLYLIGCSIGQKAEPIPKRGVLQLISFISNNDKNSFTNLYEFNIEEKLNRSSP